MPTTTVKKTDHFQQNHFSFQCFPLKIAVILLVLQQIGIPIDSIWTVISAMVAMDHITLHM